MSQFSPKVQQSYETIAKGLNANIRAGAVTVELIHEVNCGRGLLSHPIHTKIAARLLRTKSHR